MNNDTQTDALFERATTTTQRLFEALQGIIRGRDDTLRLLLTALIADGHVLLEDYPGSGKTTLTKALGKLIAKDASESSEEHIRSFRRIQFTPDMLPGDVLGVNIFEPRTGQFRFMHGPVFAYVVLADEINRTGPKVQAAFLECMAEKQVTIDNVTYPLDELFFVVGTQNPLDIAGTYPLPLVQLDRFLLKLPMAYVDAAVELEILESHHSIRENLDTLTPVSTRNEVLGARAAARAVHISPSLRNAIVALVQSTRSNPTLQYGASTRAAIMLQEAMRAWALINRRTYCSEDDLKTLAPYVLLHRLAFRGISESPREALLGLLEPVIERLIRA